MAMALKLLGILGAGGQARETAEFMRNAEPAFFAVERPYFRTGQALNNLRLIDLANPSAVEREGPVVAAVGGPGLRCELVTRWPGEHFMSAISDHAYLAADALLAEGCMIAPGAVLMTGVVLGRHVLVNAGVSIGHGTVVEEFATLSPGVRIGGGCHVGRGSFLGIGAAVSNGVNIGAGARVGAGAVVLHDLEPGGVYVGVPVRLVRYEEEWLREF